MSNTASQVLPPWPGAFVDAAGRRLYVRAAPGRSPGAAPAVYVHGLGGAGTNWTDLMGLLSDRLDGIAPDLPGFGRSDPPAGRDYSVRAHADAVAALIEGHGAGPVHLFGNSLGGAIATRVAALRPELVRSLVLISPALPTYLPRRSNAHLPTLALPWVGERLAKRWGRVAVERRVRAGLSLCYADVSAVHPQRLEEALEEARRRAGLPHDGEALLRSLRGLLSDFLSRGPDAPWRLAARVAAPTLLVYGKRDRLVDPAGAARAVRTFPRASLTVLPRTGHVAQMEHPEVVDALVRRHLGAVASTTPVAAQR